MKNNSNILRLVIGVILAFILVFASVKIGNRIAASKKRPASKVTQKITKIFIEEVTNETIPITVSEKGKLEARNQVEIYAEVQGIVKRINKTFKAGEYYSNGELMISLDDAEVLANLRSQRANLYNLIVQVMPDLQLDYPDAFEKWNKYLHSLDVNESIPELPEFDSDQEKFFISGRNIISTFYNIKNAEERHKKYRIYSPLSGTLTEGLITKGSLVRVGQKLGTIINPNSLEMPLSVPETFRQFVEVGQSVEMRSLDGKKTYTGKITRINPTINTVTQGITIFIEIYSKELKAGQFLQVDIKGKDVEDAYTIDRNLLVDMDQVFAKQGDSLVLKDVTPLFFGESTVVVSGLEDGTEIIRKQVPGAFEGMIVEKVEE